MNRKKRIADYLLTFFFALLIVCPLVFADFEEIGRAHV